jgi:hypothetical protein
MNKSILLSMGVVGLLAFFSLIYIFQLADSDTTGSGVQERSRSGRVADSEDLHLSENSYRIDDSDFVDGQALLLDLPSEDLSPEEIEGILLMREEEKLAHDVYTTLYETWGVKIFDNISNSEQTHTDVMKEIIVKYDLTDPVTTDEVGIFVNENLGALYTSLVEQGKKSLLDALIVGATVEDLDIQDLEDLKAVTDNEDVLIAYENLQKGSRNHLRAFVGQIESSGGNYEPQYISQAMYEEILSSPQERGGVR